MGRHVSMARNGRIVIPVSLRSEMGLPDGGPVVMRVEDGRLVVEPYAAAVARARAAVRRYVPEDAVLSDELVADRRAEADRE